MKTVALIVAGGRGVRFGSEIPKQFRNIWDKPLLSWTIFQFEKSHRIDDVVVVVPEDYLLYTNEKVVNPYSFKKVSRIMAGGESRSESVRKGLKSLSLSTGFVAIHDGARPLISPGDIDRVIEIAQRERAAILARPIADTIKRVEGEFVISTLDRTKLYLAETPQVFQYDLIISAHDRTNDEPKATDDAYLVELLGFKIKTVAPEGTNFKITTESDLALAKFILKDENASWN